MDAGIAALIGSISGALVAGLFGVIQAHLSNRRERAALESTERREREVRADAMKRERLKIAYEAAVLEHREAWAIARGDSPPRDFMAYPLAHYLATYVRLLESEMTPDDYNRILDEARLRRTLVRHKGLQND